MGCICIGDKGISIERALNQERAERWHCKTNRVMRA